MFDFSVDRRLDKLVELQTSTNKLLENILKELQKLNSQMENDAFRAR